MMSPWNAPKYITRVWCLFELYAASENSCEVTIVMPSREVENFIHGLKCKLKGDDQIQKFFTALAATDVNNAMASVESDLAHILRIVESGPGYCKFNAEVA